MTTAQIFQILAHQPNPLPACFSIAAQADDTALVEVLMAIQAKMYNSAFTLVQAYPGSEKVQEWLQMQQRKQEGRKMLGKEVDYEGLIRDAKELDDKLQRVI